MPKIKSSAPLASNRANGISKTDNAAPARSANSRRPPVRLTEPYQQIRHKKLIDLIDRPQWTGTVPDGEPFIRQAEDTLIPDLISIVYLDGVCQFIIFDAKYYNL